MHTYGYRIPLRVCALAALLLAMSTAIAEAATPNPTSAILKTRVFNDCPASNLTTGNSYPTTIWIEDRELWCSGFTNLHIWRFSTDGTTDVAFDNDSAFRFSAEVVITGTADGDAGLSVAPWWSQDVDGQFNIRTASGEIVCFGGRLPFYSFTVDHGVTYNKGDRIRLEVTYQPHALTMEEPADITYVVEYHGVSYSSGPIQFDQGNPAEDPPYGLWGILNDARVGGFVFPHLDPGNDDAGLRAEWHNIDFEEIEVVGVESASWGKVKSLYSD